MRIDPMARGSYMKKLIAMAAIAFAGCNEQAAYNFEDRSLENADYIGESPTAGIYLVKRGDKVTFIAIIDGYERAGTCQFEIDAGTHSISIPGTAAIEGSCRASTSKDAIVALCDGDQTAQATIDGMERVRMDLMCYELNRQ